MKIRGQKFRRGEKFRLTVGCAPASPAAQFLCSIARIRQDISAASLCSWCPDAFMSVFYSPVLTRSLIFLQLWTAVS